MAAGQSPVHISHPLDLVGRESELRLLLSYITAGENQTNLVTKGRGGGLSNFVFSLPSFLRAVQGFLADRQFPPILLEGSPGSGKSALLQAAAALVEDLSGLHVVVHSFEAAPLLRRLYDGIDEVTDEELLLVPVVSNAGKQGGIVLFLDDVSDLSWLPVPLPLGVRCVVAGAHPEWPADATRTLDLRDLAAAEATKLQKRLGLERQCVFPDSVNPLWLRLASQLQVHQHVDDIPEDLTALVQALVAHAESSIGQAVIQESLCALVCSRNGLLQEDLEAVLTVQLGDAAVAAWASAAACLSAMLYTDASGMHLKKLLADVVADRYLQTTGIRQAWHERFAQYFVRHRIAERRIEAPYHLAALGDRGRLLESLADWATFSILERQSLPALVEYCHAAGGYSAVRDALLEHIGADGTSQQEKKLVIGRFLSHIGEFATAKDMLQSARRDALESDDKLRFGTICTQIAENEVRYWDSLRNWQNVGVLRDLLESSRTAVDIFSSCHVPGKQVWLRVEHAKALTRWANGCFKAACVCDYEESIRHLEAADEAVAKVQALFAGSPPSRVVGRALLVGGVAKLVRGHRDRDLGKPHRKTLFAAANLFHEAERLLVLSVGEINEGSIYTHGNLGELYLYDVRNLNSTLHHHIKCCLVGIKLWGRDHPNVRRKILEFAHLLSATRRRTPESSLDIPTLEAMLKEHHPMQPGDLQAWADGPEEPWDPADMR